MVIATLCNLLETQFILKLVKTVTLCCGERTKKKKKPGACLLLTIFFMWKLSKYIQRSVMLYIT